MAASMLRVLGIDHQQLAAQIASHVDLARVVDLNPVRGLIRRDVDGSGHLTRRQIDDSDGVARMRILAVDAVAVYGNVGEFVIGRDGNVVRSHSHFQVRNLLEGRRIEETDVPADFVDHDQSVRAGGIVRIHAAGGEDQRYGCESGDGEKCGFIRVAMIGNYIPGARPDREPGSTTSGRQ